MRTITNEELEKKVHQAFKLCADAGYSGGIYEGHFCAWPSSEDPHSADEFFGGVEECGGFVLPQSHEMHLDGGAGN